MSDLEQLWLVERTFSDDEQNLIILIYATLDGSKYYRKERALTSFTDSRETLAAIEVESGTLGEVTDQDDRERFSTEATRMAETHDPDDVI